MHLLELGMLCFGKRASIHIKLKSFCFQLEVRMSVEYMSFSAHADAKGIMQLISHCSPSNVLLVHGEAEKMSFLMNKIKKEFGKITYIFIGLHTFLDEV